MGVRRLERDLTGDEHAQLNPAGVSCLRSFPANGTDGTDGTEGTAVVKVWGGRTLAVSDPSWRYVNVRRLSTFVTESVRRGTRWAASEPFDDTLVQRLQENVSRFLQGLAEEGALATRGGRPGFFVRCDASVNPASPREPGTLVIMVGIAPLTPGEFVVSRIVHADPGGVA
jgi:phage tail sheath protein FI